MGQIEGTRTRLHEFPSITRRVYNLVPNEFIPLVLPLEPRAGFTKATVSAWRWKLPPTD